MTSRTPPELREQIITEYAAGYSSLELATRHGLSSNTILRIAHAAGVTRTHQNAQAVRSARIERRNELTGGRWVQGRHGIHHWQENPQ